MLYVSHAAGSVRKMCDRVLVLEKGVLGFDGDVDEGIRYLHYDDDDDVNPGGPRGQRRRRGARRRRLTVPASSRDGRDSPCRQGELQFCSSTEALAAPCYWCDIWCSCELPSPHRSTAAWPRTEADSCSCASRAWRSGWWSPIAAPAAGVVTLDIVAPPHEQPRPRRPPAGCRRGGAPYAAVAWWPPRRCARRQHGPARRGEQAGRRALQSSAAPRAAGRSSSGDAQLAAARRRRQDLAVLSAPQPVDGLATVGVTWAARCAGRRTGRSPSRCAPARGATWSAWQKVPYHEEEGPTRAAPRVATPARHRPGVRRPRRRRAGPGRHRPPGDAPAGMSLTLVDPGHESTTAVQSPAIDTGDLALSGATTHDRPPTDRPRPTAPATGDAAGVGDRQAADLLARRSGARTSGCADTSSLHYGEVHGGFVHHTVNANSYTRAQVPVDPPRHLRLPHAVTRLVRRRLQLPRRPLRPDLGGPVRRRRTVPSSAPTPSATTTTRSRCRRSATSTSRVRRAAMVDAYGRLFAWKLSLHGVRAGSTRQWVTKRYLPGDRRPPRRGADRLPGPVPLRQDPGDPPLAAEHQRSFAARARLTNLVGIGKPDSWSRGNGRPRRPSWSAATATVALGRVTATGTYLRSANRVLSAGDWNRDGHGDVVARSGRTGRLFLYRGNGRGRFGRAAADGPDSSFGGGAAARRRRRHDRRRAAGPAGPAARRLDADLPRRRRRPASGRSYVAHARSPPSQQLGVNLWNADGVPGHDGPPRRRLAGGLPGQRPRRAHRAAAGSAGSAPGYDWLLAGRRPDRRRPRRPRGPLAATGRLWLLPGASSGIGPRRGSTAARHASLRPRRLTGSTAAGRGPVSAAQLLGGALLLGARRPAGLVGVAHPDRGAAVRPARPAA